MALVALELLLSAVGTGLGVAQFLLDVGTPVKDELAQGNSRVRFGFGLSPDNYNTNKSMGGRIPSVRVYNDRRDFIGNASSPTTPEGIAEPGSYADVTVKQTIPFQQATYLEVAALENDPVCLAYIAQTWSDGTKLGWLGDIGRFCDGSYWYHSTLHIRMSNGTLYSPACTWVGYSSLLDVGPTDNPNDDHLETNKVAAIKIYMPNFGKQDETGGVSVPSDPRSICRAPSMEWIQDHGNASRFASLGVRLRPAIFLGAFEFLSHIVGTKALYLKHVARFNHVSQVKIAFGGALIGSHHTQHGGRDLCQDPKSMGPDFVSFAEGTFCDMETKTLWPLCNDAIGLWRGCFDWQTKTVVTSLLRKRQMKYRKVVEWGIA